MKKNNKKEIEFELLLGMELLLADHNKSAAKKVKRVLKDASKKVAKRFLKELKKISSKKIKTKKVKMQPVAKTKKITKSTGASKRKLKAKSAVVPVVQQEYVPAGSPNPVL